MIRLDDPAEIAEMAVRQAQAGFGYRSPIYAAAAQRIIALCEVPGGDALVPRKVLERHRLPLLIVIGDDGPDPTGPAGWRQARRLFRWARSAVIHGTGGKPRHYAAAVLMARMSRRTLFVETDTAHTEAWLELARAALPPPAILAIRTAPGAPPHPSWTRPAGAVLQ